MNSHENDTSPVPTATYVRGADPLESTRVSIDIPAKVVFKILVVIAAFGFGLLIMRELQSLLIQFAIAAFLAIALDPLINRLEHRGVGRGKSIALVFVVGFILVAAVTTVFAKPLIEQGELLAEATPGIIADIQDSPIINDLDKQYSIADRASDQLSELPSTVANQLGSVVGAVAAGVFGFITVLFLTIFLLAGGDQVVKGFVRLVPQVTERKWWNIVVGAYDGISAYVGGAIIIALIGGSVVTLSAVVLGLPYALPLGLWMMLLEIIPMIGATIGAIPVVLVAFAAGGVVEGLVMITIVVVYQQIENLIVQPRVQGKAASLSPLIVFVSVLIGSQLLGILGALFAVPVAGVVLIFIRQIIEERSGEGDDAEAPPIVERVREQRSDNEPKAETDSIDSTLDKD